MPILGQGTWRMGERPAEREAEAAALCLGLDLGMTLIDTAEMYGDAESVVGEVLKGRRDEVFLVSKVLPENASRAGTRQACERSLERLGTEVIDLYLLHWPGEHPLEETLAAFGELRDEGKIRTFGVSNFDTEPLQAALRIAGGREIAANQVVYNLTHRGIEHGLLPTCRSHGIPVMAYCPLDRGNYRGGDALESVAHRHGVTMAQVSLAWTLRGEGVVSIPKASRLDHVRENAAAMDLSLTEEDFAELDRDFPPPSGSTPLEWR